MNDTTVIDYILNAHIEGALVECGVQTGKIEKIWINKLKERNVFTKDIYLYDTFTGLTEPGPKDVGIYNGLDTPQAVYDEWAKHNVYEVNTMCYCPLSKVVSDLYETGYPQENLHFIKGDVRKTLLNENNIPKKIAVLRLDTDWYDSSKIELETMFKYLVPGGVLILDDYGYWKGQKDATDEFFKNTKYEYLINQVNIAGSHVYYLIK
jgi:hypothetical protein